MILILLFISSFKLFAGSITAEVDNKNVGVGESVQITVILNGSLKGDLNPPQIPNAEVQQTSSSTSTSIINGAITVERQFIFIVVPQKEGDIEIPPFQATLDGKSEQTLPIKLHVSQTAAPKKSNPQNDEVAETSNGEDLFIRREIPRGTFYKGQSIPTKVKIYSRRRVSKFSKPKTVSQDFRVIGLKEEKEYRENINGIGYQVSEVGEIIVPLKAGKLKSPLFSAEITYIKPRSQPRSRNGLDIFSFFDDYGTPVKKLFQSNSSEISILDIPQENMPANYMDAVGDFNDNVTISQRQVKHGDTLNIKLVIEGEGSLDLARMNLKTYLESFGRVFEEKPVVEEDTSQNILRSRRSQTFALVVEKDQDFDLGEWSYSFFSPSKKSFIDKKVTLGKISVSGASSPAPVASPQPSTQAVPVPAKNWMNEVMIAMMIILLSIIGILFWKLRAKKITPPTFTPATALPSAIQNLTSARDMKEFFTLSRESLKQVYPNQIWNNKNILNFVHDNFADDFYQKFSAALAEFEVQNFSQNKNSETLQNVSEFNSQFFEVIKSKWSAQQP